MKKKEIGSSIKRLGYSFAHWCYVVILSIVSFVVQYSFLVDTGEKTSGYIFTGSIYRVNYVTFPIGVVLFLVGYYFIWKEYLLEDWNGLKGQFWLWKVLYAIIGILALGAIFMTGISTIFWHVGLGGDIRPTWTIWGFVAFPIYVVLVPVIYWCINKKKSKK